MKPFLTFVFASDPFQISSPLAPSLYPPGSIENMKYLDLKKLSRKRIAQNI
jgi:hypothetical protein